MKIFDKFLYLYSTGFVTLLVLASAVNPDRGPSTFLIGILFAPVALYLIFSLIQYLKRPKKATQPHDTNSSTLKPILDEHQQKTDEQYRQLKPFTFSFVRQSHPLFILTVCLVILILTTTIVKSGLSIGKNHPGRDNSLVSYISGEQPINPLSQP